MMSEEPTVSEKQGEDPGENKKDEKMSIGSGLVTSREQIVLDEGEFVLDPPNIKMLRIPWKEVPHYDPRYHDVRQVQHLLDKWTPDYICSHLGHVMQKLYRITPTLSHCFATKEMKPLLYMPKFAGFFCNLMKSKGRRPRIMATEALFEVLSSKNRHLEVVLEPHEEGADSVFSVLVKSFRTSRNVDIMNNILHCFFRLLASDLVWMITSKLLFECDEVDESILDSFVGMCKKKEENVPTMIIEGVDVLVKLAELCYDAMELKRSYYELDTPKAGGEDGRRFKGAWRELESDYVDFLESLKKWRSDTFLRDYHVYTIFEQCFFLPSMDFLLHVNSEFNKHIPPNPLPFLNRLLSERYGILFLARYKNIECLFDSLFRVSEYETYPEMSYFDRGTRLTARHLCQTIRNRFKALRFCDLVRGLKGKTPQMLHDEWIIDYLLSLKDPAVRRDFSMVLGQKYLPLLIEGVTIPKDKKAATTDTHLHFMFLLITTALEEAEDGEFWTENASRLFEMAKKQTKNAVIEVPGISDGALGPFVRDSTVNIDEVAKFYLVCSTNFARLSWVGLSEAHVSRIRFAEMLCSGYTVTLGIHAVLSNNITLIVEDKFKELLEPALILFQSGMSLSAPQLSLLARFAISALNIFDHCLSADKEMSVISPSLVSSLLSLWTLTVDLNGQSSCELSTSLRLAILKLIEPHLFLSTTDDSVLAVSLVARGSERPLFFPALLEILLAVLPEQLPIPFRFGKMMAVQQRVNVMTVEHTAKVNQWADCLEAIKETTFSEVLLCSNHYVLENVSNFLKRVGSYMTLIGEDYRIIDFCASLVLERVGSVLRNSSNQQSTAAVPVSDDEKEQKEENRSKQTRASTAHVRLLETLADLSSVGYFSSALGRILSSSKDALVTLSTILSLFSNPWQKSDRQFAFQDSVIDLLSCLLRSEHRFLMQKESEEQNGPLCLILKSLIGFVVDKEQAPECVFKAAQVLSDVAKKDDVEQHQLAHLFSNGLFVPVFKNALTKDGPILLSAAASVSQAILSVTNGDAALVRRAVFDSTENTEQPLEKLVEILDSQNLKKGEEGEEILAVFEVYRLAMEGMGSQPDLSKFTGEFKNNRRFPHSRIDLQPSDFEVIQTKRRDLSKKDCRTGRGTRMGSDVAQTILKYTEKSVMQAVDELFKKREKETGKEEPFEPPPRIRWI